MAGELITRDGQIEYRGLLLGAGTPYPWVQLDGWITDQPGIETGNQPRPAGHGSWAGSMHAGERRVTFQHRVRTPDLHGAVQELAMATRLTDEEHPLVIQLHGVKRVAWARCVNRSLPIDLSYAVGVVPKAVVQWEATDPRIYSHDILTASTGLPRPGAGFTYPLTYPLDYGDAGNPGSLQAVNAWDADTPPTLTVTGDTPRPVIINRTTGARLILDLTVTEADELVVDTREGLVLLNGVNRAFSVADESDHPEDFLLAPGVNDVDFRASGASDTARLTMTWQHASM
jgi:hypothetical protein